jgi:hypothetical protein
LVAVPERRRSRNWRFADSGSRFDVNPRVAARDRQPIAPTFTRKIVRCRRCGSRIVSNARRCPYCSKSVVPFYRTFAFWLSLVLLLAACTVYFVVFFNPATEPPAGSGVRAPLALGVPNPQETTNLPLGTSVDSNDLIITVMSVRQVGTASDGRTIYEVALQLFNKTPNRQALYTTQWQMQNLDGSREECFRGKTSDGSSLTNGVDGRQMAPDEVFTTKIYFATDNPLCVIFLQNPLDVENGSDVSWDVGLLAAPPDQGSPEPDSGQQ